MVVDCLWMPMWAFNFGLHDYTEKELEIMAATYDATLAELDDLFKSLITSLEASGDLENTIVILTADHGEHLGEHHMMDHQFSLYSGLIRVPLILHMPERIQAGRSSMPVANFDIYPTLLELADVAPPAGWSSSAVSLLNPQADRARLAELPATFFEPFPAVKQAYPEFDPAPWDRKLRAYQVGKHKLIWSSLGNHELYDIAADPQETRNLIEEQPELAHKLLKELVEFMGTLQAPVVSGQPPGSQSAEYLQMLKDLGYVGEDLEEAPGKEREDAKD